jgi:hypothetical protein
MKAATIAAVLAPAVVNAQWWGGAPDCAQNCFSSLWSSQSTAWPAPTSYCQATQAASVTSCINSACSATPTAITSYSSLQSSLCAQWSSCQSAGSTGVYTVSLPAFTGSWGPGGRGGPGGFGGPGGPGGRGPWGGDLGATKTWTGGVYTVTGCEWSGSPWAGGPGGWTGGLNGNPWGNWGHGWSWSTATTTVTQIITVTQGGVTSLSTSIGLGTVALAVSGDITQTSVITGGSAAPTGNVAPKDGAQGVKVMGALLGGVVAVAGLL